MVSFAAVRACVGRARVAVVSGGRGGASCVGRPVWSCVCGGVLCGGLCMCYVCWVCEGGLSCGGLCVWWGPAWMSVCVGGVSGVLCGGVCVCVCARVCSGILCVRRGGFHVAASVFARNGQIR